MPRGEKKKKKSAIPFTFYSRTSSNLPSFATHQPTFPKGNYILWIEYKKKRRWWEARKFTSTFSLCMPALLASMQSVTSKNFYYYLLAPSPSVSYSRTIFFGVYANDYWIDVMSELFEKRSTSYLLFFISQINLISLFCTSSSRTFFLIYTLK